MSDAEKVELCKILQTMDIPISRLDDIFWIQRNLSIKNKNNPNLKRALELVKIKVIEEIKNLET